MKDFCSLDILSISLPIVSIAKSLHFYVLCIDLHTGPAPLALLL